MRVTLAVTVDGRTETVTVDVNAKDAGVDDVENVATMSSVMLARLLEAAQEGASAEARKRSRLDPRHRWAGFLRDLRQRFERAPSAQPLDVDAFALGVAHALAWVRSERVPTGVGGALVQRGRFGEHKVFIAAVYRALRSAHSQFRKLSLDEFKAQLLEANRVGLLALSRADLVGAMDPEEVAASAIEDRGASFHFVELPRPR